MVFIVFFFFFFFLLCLFSISRNTGFTGIFGRGLESTVTECSSLSNGLLPRGMLTSCLGFRYTWRGGSWFAWGVVVVWRARDFV